MTGTRTCGAGVTDDFGVARVALFSGDEIDLIVIPPEGSGCVQVRRNGIELLEDGAVVVVLPCSQADTIVIKEVTVPQGGTSFGFEETISVPAGSAPNSFTLDDGQTKILSGLTPDINGLYVITQEEQTDGSTLTALVCVDSDSSGIPSVTDIETGEATINLDPGELVYCTFTNTYVTTLTVIKHVINDNTNGVSGSSAVASDFTMDILGTNVSKTGFSGSESGVTVTLGPGAYSVGESGGPSGYAMSLSADCSGTIALGEAKTCTITNDDIEAQITTLTVIKHVINDNTGGVSGSSAVASDFTMDILGTNVSKTGFSGSESGVTVTLGPGAYSVGESGGPSGYAMSLSADCSGTIALGEAKTCTITNDDVDPVLEANKIDPIDV